MSDFTMFQNRPITSISEEITQKNSLSSAFKTQFIAVASGKGGVGKTWFTISLAQRLARQGHKVLIFDGDFGLANVDIQLGLMPQYDLVDVLGRRIALGDAIQSCTLGQAKFDVLPGRAGVPAAAGIDSGALNGLLTALRKMSKYDVVLLDLCAGIDPVTRHLSAMSDILLAVTTEEPTALTDVYAVMKLYARDRVRLGEKSTDCRLVINQVSTHRSGQQTFDKLAQACKNFLGWTPVLAGMIRKDTRVPAAIRMQSSILVTTPNSFASVDVARLADRLNIPENASLAF